MGFGADALDALERAAQCLPGGDPAAHVFLESRLERRIEVGTDGPPSAMTARLQGMAAESAPGSGTFASAPSLEDLDGLARSAGTDASVTPFPGTAAVPETTPEPDTAELAAALTELVDRARRAAGGVPARALYVEVDQQVAVARRDGSAVEDRRHGRRVRLEVGVAVAERALSPGAVDLEGLEQVAAGRALARRRLMPPWPGRTPAVFAPGVGGVLLHELIGHALEGDGLLRGGSRLGRAAGPVAPEGVTVLDDPRRSRLAWKVDDEGVEARATALVQGGRVVGALSSWGWPGSPRASSGHGRRASFAEPALPRMGATFLAPGSLHPDEVLDGIARGIYVRRMAAAWTDPAKGSAVFHVTDADEVIGGEIRGPLGSFLLMVQVEDLAGLDRIGDDLAFDTCIGVCVREGQALASSVGAPTFRLGLVTVAA